MKVSRFYKPKELLKFIKIPTPTILDDEVLLLLLRQQDISPAVESFKSGGRAVILGLGSENIHLIAPAISSGNSFPC